MHVACKIFTVSFLQSPKAVFDKSEEDLTFDLSYDEAKLQEKVNSLGIAQAGQAPAQSASPSYDGR